MSSRTLISVEEYLRSRQIFVATAANGLREVKSGVLRAENPLVELPLAGLWD